VEDYLNELAFDTSVSEFDDGLDNAMIDEDPNPWPMDETAPMHSVDIGSNPTQDTSPEGSKNGRFVPYTTGWANISIALAAITKMDRRRRGTMMPDKKGK